VIGVPHLCFAIIVAKRAHFTDGFSMSDQRRERVAETKADSRHPVSPSLIERQAHTPVFRRGLSDTWSGCPGRLRLMAPIHTDATDSVSCRPRTTRGGEPAVVRTAMTWNPMGPHWPGHSPTRETNESSPGVSPVPSECGLEPKGIGRPNPMVGFLRVHAGEEVNESSGFELFYISKSGCDAGRSLFRRYESLAEAGTGDALSRGVPPEYDRTACGRTDVREHDPGVFCPRPTHRNACVRLRGPDCHGSCSCARLPRKLFVS
jgi:hypothetical protein